jgi:membrane associated rhomboid family serine protease
VIGYWFIASNLLPAVLAFDAPQVRGVALFAHIGGFLAGLLLIRPLRKPQQHPSFQWAGWRPPPRSRGSSSRSRYEAWRDH